jgi:CO/xanthine dehydrogenase Mo-binding subunit
MQELTYVGRSLLRQDGVDKLTGAARYAIDLQLPSMTVGKLLRSPYAHARIKRIDTSEAMTIPGVLAVLTAEDLGTPVPRFGPLVADQPVLAHEFVRFCGEPVAAVAAIDEATARAALKAIEVGWEELPAVANLDAALVSDAPLVVNPTERAEDDPGRTTNVVREFSYEWGELPEACDLVLEHEYNFPAVHHYAIEPLACIAAWDTSGLTVWSGVQHPFQLRRVLATTLGLPLSKVQVCATDLGGSFGGKGYPKIEPIVALLARATGRPVKVSLSVEDTFHSARRSSARIRVRTGVDADGNIRFQEVAGDFLVGAYADISLRVRLSRLRPLPHTGCADHRARSSKQHGSEHCFPRLRGAAVVLGTGIPDG